MSEREQLADLGMVCDAYGLPHSAVALARHLTNNADHAIAVWRDTCRVLEEQRDNAASEALAPVLALADECERLDAYLSHDVTDLTSPMGWRGVNRPAWEVIRTAAALRAAAGTPTHHTTEEETQ